MEYPETCVEWPGSKDRYGYPITRVGKGRAKSVGKLMLALFCGPGPKNAHALHSCDNPACINPACINPAHLRWGTPKDNSDDKVSRKRHPVGSRHMNSKLTEEAVSEIRAGSIGLGEAKARYGIGKSSFYRARIGDSWRHVEGQSAQTAESEGVAA